jgi:hypothetical protein
MQVNGNRKVVVNTAVIDQFAVYNVDEYTKVSGLTSGDMTKTVFIDGAVDTSLTVTVTEIGVLGEYKVAFTPTSLGFYEVEVAVPTYTERWKGCYDVCAVDGAPTSGQVFYDTVRNNFGNAMPYVTVRALRAGTSTALWSGTTDVNGSYSITLSGALAVPILVDLEFSGGGITTFKKTNIRLF